MTPDEESEWWSRLTWPGEDDEKLSDEELKLVLQSRVQRAENMIAAMKADEQKIEDHQ